MYFVYFAICLFNHIFKLDCFFNHGIPFIDILLTYFWSLWSRGSDLYRLSGSHLANHFSDFDCLGIKQFLVTFISLEIVNFSLKLLRNSNLVVGQQFEIINFYLLFIVD